MDERTARGATFLEIYRGRRAGEPESFPSVVVRMLCDVASLVEASPALGAAWAAAPDEAQARLLADLADLLDARVEEAFGDVPRVDLGGRP